MDHNRSNFHLVVARRLRCRVFSGFPKTGNWVHVLVVIAVILVILKLLGIILTHFAAQMIKKARVTKMSAFNQESMPSAEPGVTTGLASTRIVIYLDNH